VILNTLLEFQG